MTFKLPHDDLAALEARVQQALRAGHPGDLDILDYGEITLVVRIDTAEGALACKRLPVFGTPERFADYEQILGEYLDRLAAADIRVAPTRLWSTVLPSGDTVAYVVQPVLPPERLCSRLLHTEDEVWAKSFFERYLDLVDGAVTPTLGLDAQASNWIDVDGELVYLDVTTPMMRDAKSKERADVRLFFESLPWVLRDGARMAMSKSIFDKFYEPRGVVLDFLGNLHKEKLEHLVPGFLEQANPRFDKPVTREETASYYAEDARLWELVQRLRRMDRFWQMKVRRRPYPFLLPGHVDR